MAAASSTAAAGSSLGLVDEYGPVEFWVVNGNEAAHQNPRPMNTTHAIHIFSGPRDVIGTLKAVNSKDPDILHASMSPVEMQARFARIAGLLFMIMGALVCLTIIGIPVGLLFIAGGWFLRRKVKQQQEKIKAAYEQFCLEQGIGLKAA